MEEKLNAIMEILVDMKDGQVRLEKNQSRFEDRMSLFEGKLSSFDDRMSLFEGELSSFDDRMSSFEVSLDHVAINQVHLSESQSRFEEKLDNFIIETRSGFMHS